MSLGLMEDMVREAVEAIPPSIAARLGECRVELAADPGFRSQWRRTGEGLEVTVATAGVEEHDVALEVLLCVGQALWETTTPAEREAWLRVVGRR